MDNQENNKYERKIGNCCTRGAWAIFLIQLLQGLMFATELDESSNSILAVKSIVDFSIVLIIAAVPVSLSYMIVKNFSMEAYDQKTLHDLRSEKDQYKVWGAGGTALLAILNQNHAILSEFIGYLMLSALYTLVIFCIHYRRLSAAIYRKEETSVIIMSKERNYTITAINNNDNDSTQ